MEWHDIQGIALYGHGHLPAARYLFLRVEVDKVAQASAWLAAMAGAVTTAEPRREAKPTQAVQLALTFEGLRALELPEPTLGTFLQEFQDGMAHAQRARILGDNVESAPQHWEYGGPGNPVHAALLLFARNQTDLEELCRVERARYAAAGLTEVACQSTEFRAGDKEPFGFRDGIAQPRIEGVPSSGRTVEPEVPAGEFVLGYRNAYGQLPFSPSLPEQQDPGNLLPPAAQPGRKDLGRNGTYLVLRKLEQDVEGFRQFCESNSGAAAQGVSPEDRAEWIAARLMGRWRSGAPLVVSPHSDDPALGADPERNNRFAYAGDPTGLRCPVGSHIRRSNPRDVLSTDGTDEALAVVARHRILRRGRAYREEAKSGIVFVAINANIARQFEFIQQTWLNNPKFNGLYDSRDPVAGASMEPKGNGAGTCTMVIPADPFRRRLNGVPRFVRTRGGDYFFLPGRRALKYLGSLHATHSS